MNIKSISEKYLEDLKSVKRYSFNTIKSYTTDLQEFVSYCDENSRTEAGKITDKFVKSFLMVLTEKGISKKSISRKLAAIRGLFKFAFEKSYLDHNPTSYISNPKSSRKLPEIVSEKTILKTYDEADEDGRLSKKDGEKEAMLVKVIIELLYGCALRVDELCNLNNMDIDLKEKIIKVKGKGNKTRIVPVGNKSLEIVKRYLSLKNNNGGKEALIIKLKGGRIYPRYVYRIVNKYLSKVTDIKKKSPHILRHSAATHMLDNGADLRAVKEILGHENLSTTQIYTHVSVERLKSAYKKAHPKS